MDQFSFLAFSIKMTNKKPIEELPIIEVPPELRGLSDEEILALHPVDPEKRDRFRPSKKEREAKKLAKEQEKIRKIAEQYKNRDSLSYVSRPMPKMSDYDGSRGSQSAHRAAAPKKTLFVPSQMKKAASAPTPSVSPVKPSVTPLPPRQSSGRVLVGSFGGKFGATKTQLISQSDLAKKHAEEEAKRQKELAKKRAAAALLAKASNDPNSLFKADSPLGEGLASPEVPVKRKRGRPRKNPLPDQL